MKKITTLIGLLVIASLLIPAWFIGWQTALAGLVYFLLGMSIVYYLRARPKPINNDRSEMVSGQASVTEVEQVLDRISQINSEQIMLLEEEQKQVADLINDAVKKLTDSFNDMRNVNEEQHTIFNSLFKKGDKESSFEEFVAETESLLVYFVDMVLKNGKDSVYLMQRLDDMVERVNSVLSLLENVKDVSSNIHLLSLNASIEAARAGDAGRGFSVVAEEIRSLSVQADNISDQINNLSNDMIEKLDTVTDVVNRVASNDMNRAMDGKKKVAEMTAHLKQENEAVNQSIVKSEELSTVISHSVSQAMISLQFEDMCRQLIEHQQKRLSIVKEVNQISQDIQAIDTDRNTIESFEQLLNTLSDKLTSLEPMVKESEHQSVKQQKLDASEVEFF